jgi:hypothetical protein
MAEEGQNGVTLPKSIHDFSRGSDCQALTGGYSLAHLRRLPDLPYED